MTGMRGAIPKMGGLELAQDLYLVNISVSLIDPSFANRLKDIS